MSTCPKCASQDAVQKASAIVAGGTYQTTYNVPAQGQLGGHTIYGTVQQTGTAQTALAQRLSVDHSEKNWKKWAESYRRALAAEWIKEHPRPKRGCLGTGLYVIGLLASLGGCLVSATVVGSGSMDTYGAQATVIVVVSALVAVAGLVLALRAEAGFGAPPEYREWAKLRTAAARKEAREAKRIQKQTFSRWDSLYYCHRCDLVFLPDEGLSAPAGEMMQLLMWR